MFAEEGEGRIGREVAIRLVHHENAVEALRKGRHL